MRPRFLPLLALVAATFFVGIESLHAQSLFTPFLGKEGTPAAEKAAKDSIGADANLIFIGTGKIDQGLLKSEFNTDNGKAEIWGYLFHSPSAAKSQIVVVYKLLGSFNAMILADAPFPLPDGTTPLDVSGTYSNSDKLIDRLQSDTAFQRYQTKYPTNTPTIVSLGDILPSDAGYLPNGFPLGQPTWTVSFQGEGDSALICFVAANTGEAFCQRIEIPSSVRDESARATASLSILPNPASGRVRVEVVVPEGMNPTSGVGVALYDATGAKVLDLTESFARNDFRYAEFDASTLPAGNYFCRAIGKGWSGMSGVAVTASR